MIFGDDSMRVALRRQELPQEPARPARRGCASPASTGPSCGRPRPAARRGTARLLSPALARRSSSKPRRRLAPVFGGPRSRLAPGVRRSSRPAGAAERRESACRKALRRITVRRGPGDLRRARTRPRHEIETLLKRQACATSPAMPCGDLEALAPQLHARDDFPPDGRETRPLKRGRSAPVYPPDIVRRVAPLIHRGPSLTTNPLTPPPNRKQGGDRARSCSRSRAGDASKLHSASRPSRHFRALHARLPPRPPRRGN